MFLNTSIAALSLLKPQVNCSAIFYKPGVAGACSFVINWLSHWSFSSRSSKHHKNQTVRARKLKFWENVHPTPYVICHLSNVTYQVSPVMCHRSHVSFYFYINYYNMLQSTHLCLETIGCFLIFPSLRQSVIILLLGRSLLGAKGREEGKGSRMGSRDTGLTNGLVGRTS